MTRTKICLKRDKLLFSVAVLAALLLRANDLLLGSPLLVTSSTGPYVPLQARLLLGIAIESQQQRKVIEQTYLRYYQDSPFGLDRETICPVLSETKTNEIPWIPSTCRILYMFYRSTGASGSSKHDPCGLNERCFEGVTLRDPPATIQWLRYAQEKLGARVHFDYVGHIEASCMMQPPIVLDVLDRFVLEESKPASTGSVFASTPFVDLLDCATDTQFRGEHAVECRRSPSGRIYWLSRGLVSKLWNWKDSNWIDYQELHADLDIAIRTWITRPLTSTENVHFLRIPNQARATRINDWKPLWQELMSSIHYQNQTMGAARDLPVTYVTAKFSRNDKFRRDVDARRSSLLWSHGWRTERLFTYSTFPSFVLDDPTWEEHLAFLKNSKTSDKGAGYWFWKAPLILHHLQQLDSVHEFVLYVDADLGDHMEWVSQLYHAMTHEKDAGPSFDLALYQMPYLEREWTKPQVLDEFCGMGQGAAEPFGSQFAAGVLLLRNTPASRNLMQDWITAASRWELINDDLRPEDGRNSSQTFHEHRHDQSLLSVLLNCKRNFTFVTFLGATTLRDWTVQMLSLS